MDFQQAVIAKAAELGFADVGFTTAEPFEHQKEILKQREAGYAWTAAKGLDLMAGTEPARVLPGARSIVVLLELYFNQAFPKSLENHFGRCYLDDDRVTKDGLSLRIKAFRDFLAENGCQVKVPWNLSHRLAAARAGLGDFGKNCLFYSKRAGGGSSFVLPIAFVVDKEFAPGAPTMGVGCPAWCKNVCLTACPTGALKGPRKLDPRRCISYLTYYGEGLTPLELREPMGLWVYGCDRCQNVCPRNAAWLAAELPPNRRAAAKAPDFALEKLLNMSEEYFQGRVWPHMFYMSPKNLWRWRMNVARAMGNSANREFVPKRETPPFKERNNSPRSAMSVSFGPRSAGSWPRRAATGSTASSLGDRARKISASSGVNRCSRILNSMPDSVAGKPME